MPRTLDGQKERTLTQVWVTRRRAIAAIVLIAIALTLVLLLRGWNKVPTAPGAPGQAPMERSP